MEVVEDFELRAEGLTGSDRVGLETEVGWTGFRMMMRARRH